MSDGTITEEVADIEEFEASRGTVRVVINNPDDAYVDQDAECVLSDWNEAVDYLSQRGYEIMDETECAPSWHQWGCRWWAARIDGGGE